MSASLRLWTLPLSALVVLAGCGTREDPGDHPPKHVLLISLDTLRADHCGFHGYQKPTTPFLDTLAARGVVFENHFANSNCTLPSHASILTGLLMPAHGVKVGKTGRGEIIPVPDKALTLAESFSKAGYTTRGLTSHKAWLNEAYGFNQGFDYFSTRWRDAKETLVEYLGLLDDPQPEKTFTFLHFFDIHSDSSPKGPCLPYESTPKLVAEFAGPIPEGFTGCSPTQPDLCASKYLQRVSRERQPLAAEHLEFLRGLYDAGIRKLDRDLEILFGELEKRGLLEETLVVITADHGEAFQEHGTLLHDSHHDEDARVPLIIVLPSRFEVPPRRIYGMTQSTDLAPTILELCGLQPVGQTQSLASSVMLGIEPDPALVLFHSHILISEDEVSEFKYIKTGRNRLPIFFDRTADPGETYDLMQDEAFRKANKERLTRIAQQLDEILGESLRKHRALTREQPPGQKMPEALRQELEDLGYFGTAEDGEETEGEETEGE